MTPAKGQIWKEVDPRFNRFVRVERVTLGGHVAIRTVIRDAGSWISAPRSRELLTKPERFNGKRGGFEFQE
jgi:hypothetical protein